LIEAAAAVKNHRKDVYFLICGDGSQIDYMKELSAKHDLKNHIIFAGFRKDIPYIFSIMDFMVLPSLTEGLPNVVLESFIQKKPVVVTQVGGVPEVVTDGQNGYMVPSKSSQALAHAILSLVNDPEKSKNMGLEGYKKVINSFSFDEQNRKLEKIYLSLLKG
jgi:glycosyltransferase involved in cell wall biosynthesis